MHFALFLGDSYEDGSRQAVFDLGADEYFADRNLGAVGCGKAQGGDKFFGA